MFFSTNAAISTTCPSVEVEMKFDMSVIPLSSTIALAPASSRDSSASAPTIHTITSRLISFMRMLMMLTRASGVCSRIALESREQMLVMQLAAHIAVFSSPVSTVWKRSPSISGLASSAEQCSPFADFAMMHAAMGLISLDAERLLRMSCLTVASWQMVHCAAGCSQRTDRAYIAGLSSTGFCWAAIRRIVSVPPPSWTDSRAFPSVQTLLISRNRQAMVSGSPPLAARLVRSFVAGGTAPELQMAFLPPSRELRLASARSVKPVQRDCCPPLSTMRRQSAMTAPVFSSVGLRPAWAERLARTWQAHMLASSSGDGPMALATEDTASAAKQAMDSLIRETWASVRSDGSATLNDGRPCKILHMISTPSAFTMANLLAGSRARLERATQASHCTSSTLSKVLRADISMLIPRYSRKTTFDWSLFDRMDRALVAAVASRSRSSLLVKCGIRCTVPTVNSNAPSSFGMPPFAFSCSLTVSLWHRLASARRMTDGSDKSF
mmetsp:Transcript_515/g.1134  ORF Transcript_515/g.1134 Transcript_515/m.1134 type:complete len:496 (-) Transcript_515:622-2109(-)